jgi:hypothetical protein
LREEHTDAKAHGALRPSEFIRTTTDSLGTECPMTVPSPSGVETQDPIAGALS